MGFDALIEKVRQAEVALEAKERQTAADLRQMRASWRAMWTPGRIVIAGLVSGFLVARAEPFKKAAGGGTLQLISALSSLFAGGSAQAAAEQASDAARVAETGAPPSPQQPASQVSAPPVSQPAAQPASQPSPQPANATQVPPAQGPETFRGQGHL
jgi:hypothetical protein